MSSLRVMLGVLAIGLVTSGVLLGDDKKDANDTPTKAKGQLPPNWGKLGLTDKQKQQVYKTQEEYRERIEKLKGELKKLQEQEKADLFKVLSEEQRTRLKEILAGKAGDAPKDDKKKDSDKKDSKDK